MTFKNLKSLTLCLLLFSSFIFSQFIMIIQAQDIFGSELIFDSATAFAESIVTLTVNINTTDGPYHLLFDGAKLLSGNAVGKNVTTTFSVPHDYGGIHNVTILDVTSGNVFDAPFWISPSISFKVLNSPLPPAQFQEGCDVEILVNITGGTLDLIQPFTIQTPDNNTVYESLSNITINNSGDYLGQFVYPADFSNGANTNFVGNYNVFFNETMVNQFLIGLTNSSEYHRGDVVHISGEGYDFGQTVTINISSVDEIIDSFSYTLIKENLNTTWIVPMDLAKGRYSLTIEPQPVFKNETKDFQFFELSGFKTEVLTTNLAGENASEIFLRFYDKSTNIYYNSTSDSNGLVEIMLEPGNYFCEAYFKEVNVGDIEFSVLEETQVNLTCKLTILHFSILNEQGIHIPFASIELNYNYTSNLNPNGIKNGQETGETNIQGLLQFNSILSDISYELVASRYNVSFSKTIFYVPDDEFVNVTLICPTINLSITLVDSNNQPLSDVNVEVKELMGGLVYRTVTNVTGNAQLSCTFGSYLLTAVKDDFVLNETIFTLFEATNKKINIGSSNIVLYIKIIDFLNQPIVNANVTLRNESNHFSDLTQLDGNIVFDNLMLNNDWQLTVSLGASEESLYTRYLSLNDSDEIVIKLEKYVSIMGLFFQTNQLIPLVIIIIVLLLLLVVEKREIGKKVYIKFRDL